MAFAINLDTAPANITVLGTLGVHEGSVMKRTCINPRELYVGDTIYASGFPRGACRKVLEIRQGGRAVYIRTVEGWWRYQHVYTHVAGAW